MFSLLAFLGLFIARRKGHAEAVPFAVVLLVFPLIYYVSHTSLRYRHPIDPIMAVLVAYAVTYPLTKLAQVFRANRAAEELSQAR